MILIAVAMVAFNQDWHVEEERPIGDELPPVDPARRPRADSRRGGGRRRQGATRHAPHHRDAPD